MRQKRAPSWQRWFSTTAKAVGVLCAVIAGVAALTGNMTSIYDFTQKLTMPSKSGREVTLRDARKRSVELLDQFRNASGNITPVLKLELEVIADKKSRDPIDNCKMELFGGGREFYGSDSNLKNAQEYIFDEGTSSSFFYVQFYIPKEEFPSKAKIRMMCWGVATPWVEVADMDGDLRDSR